MPSLEACREAGESTSFWALLYVMRDSQADGKLLGTFRSPRPWRQRVLSMDLCIVCYHAAGLTYLYQMKSKGSTSSENHTERASSFFHISKVPASTLLSSLSCIQTPATRCGVLSFLLYTSECSLKTTRFSFHHTICPIFVSFTLFSTHT